MKKFGIIVFTALLAMSFASTDSEIGNSQAFKAGEELHYVLYYGLVNGGAATITLRETTMNNKQVLHAKASMKTTGMADWIFGIEDVYESYFDDANKCKPLKAIRNIKENKYRYYEEVTFDHAKKTVTSTKNGTISTPTNMYDLISSLYYIRKEGLKNLKTNDTISMLIYFSDEVYPYKLIYKGREKISTKMGKYNALKLQPLVEVGRIFKTKDDVSFWVSDDVNHVPLRVEFNMTLGSLKCDLVSYKGLEQPLQKL
ncbi:MAG: DUF3108 domain-containing protein [Bacteroidales bacterium]|nr:DUF3108 domain-containing protein [Bacteroidales bacterium]